MQMGFIKKATDLVKPVSQRSGVRVDALGRGGDEWGCDTLDFSVRCFW